MSLLFLWLVACTSQPTQLTVTPTVAAFTSHIPTATITSSPVACNVTGFSTSLPPDEHTASFTLTWYSNSEDTLWCGLSPQIEGKWYGGVGHKVLWWRGRSGTLHVEAKHLEEPFEVRQAAVPDGYGDIGLQAGGVYLPTAGCWEIAARTETDELRFIVYAHPLHQGEIDCIFQEGVCLAVFGRK